MTRRLVKIDDSSLIRDMSSKALMETNPRKAEEYMARRKQLKERFSEKDERISALEDEIKEVKNLLNRLIELQTTQTAS